MQLVDEKVPPELVVKVTAPVGTICAPDPVSFTVTAQAVVARGETEFGLQVTVTETGLSCVV